MSEKRSDALLHSAHKSQEQFDYFIMALISALVAYYSKEIPASKFSSISYDCYLASFSLLLLAMYCGFIRIEVSILNKRNNGRLLDVAEKKAAYVTTYYKMKDDELVPRLETGETLTKGQVKLLIETLDSRVPEMQRALDETSSEMFSYYTWRNRLFLFGFLGLFAAKVVAPYLG